MKSKHLLSVGAAVLAVGLFAAQHHEGWHQKRKDKMTFTADRMAVDNVTKVAIASGHVHAVSAPYSLRGEYLERDDAGTITFHNPTCVTTCTNEVGHTHWNVTGEVIYKDHDSVVVHDAWVKFYEVPVLYLPYLWYPLDTKCGFRWMPGYMGRWGAFLLTQYSYNIVGDPSHGPETWWLKGKTNFDMRTKNGFALGEDLDWNLGQFGRGSFRVYYAWDQYADHRYNRGRDDKYANWGSNVDDRRYGLSLSHRWQVTERDTVSIRASRYSDSYFRNDFYRKSFFEIKEQWQSYQTSGVFWEHLENAFVFGAETSGRLNDFYAATERLPEFFLDVNPTSLLGLPVNYESQNRIGWLDRRYAEYAAGKASVFGTNPGLWCDYDAFRADTYHRLTAPFRMADDILSVVPRTAFRGTYWDETGGLDLRGESPARDRGDMFRSIGEVGVTFAARGNGWVDDACSHMIEPYLDVLCQKAWYSGSTKDRRPYVFDNLDASMAWEDQFAGRGRNLPYSYYGLTPGLRNVWSCLEESGNLHQVLDFDVYAAVMFDEAELESVPGYGQRKAHELAKLGDRNYGKHGVNVMPGARLRWTPSDDMSLLGRVEYDADSGRMAASDVKWKQKVSSEFTYTATYGLRDHRYWDFSSTPYNPKESKKEDLNYAKYHYVRLGAEYQPLDWLALGPYVRWDLREGELDSVGTWIDYLTDCIGYRLQIEYDNGYTRIDGYEHKSDTSVGFYIYLRAMGSNSAGLFGGH